MIYHNEPVSPHTASHAASYLRQAQAIATAHGVGPQDAYAHVAATVTVPCRAVGVGRQALIAAGSIQGALVLLESDHDR